MTEYQIYRKVLECVRKNTQLCKFLKSHKALHNFVRNITERMINYNDCLDFLNPKKYKQLIIFYISFQWRDTKQGYAYWYNLCELYQLYLHERNL